MWLDAGWCFKRFHKRDKAFRHSIGLADAEGNLIDPIKMIGQNCLCHWIWCDEHSIRYLNAPNECHKSGNKYEICV